MRVPNLENTAAFWLEDHFEFGGSRRIIEIATRSHPSFVRRIQQLLPRQLRRRWQVCGSIAEIERDQDFAGPVFTTQEKALLRLIYK
jgi:hypothetical protein